MDVSQRHVILNEGLCFCVRYIFEGLGHLTSTILINSAQFLKRINENGVKKMCRNIMAIQQSLTNITNSRESDLDSARQYYELLYLKSDVSCSWFQLYFRSMVSRTVSILQEILRVVMEHGPQFSEQQYVNLLTLAQRSGRAGSEEQLTSRIERLKHMLKEYESLV